MVKVRSVVLPDFAHSKRATGLRFLWLTLLLFVIDQVTKIWWLVSSSCMKVAWSEGLFNFTYVHNYGVHLAL